MAKLEDVILRGTTLAKPAANAVPVGTLYFDTDLETLERSSGAAWETYAPTGGGAGSDTTAIHDNVASEISAIAEKAVPIAADMIIIEDSADGNNKKMVQLGNLPGGGGVPDFSIWLPDAPPAVAGADDDEFADASGGLPTGWTEFDPDTVQTVGEDEQGCTLFQATHAGDRVSGIYKSIPGGDFTIVAKVGLCAKRADFVCAGLALWENAADAAKGIYTFYLQYNSTDSKGDMAVQVARWTNRTTFNTDVLAQGHDVGFTDLYFRIRRNGTTYYFDWSNDGVGWHAYTNASLAFTPTHYGPSINNVNSGADVMGRFQFFRYKDSDVGITGLLEGDRVGMNRN